MRTTITHALETEVDGLQEIKLALFALSGSRLDLGHVGSGQEYIGCVGICLGEKVAASFRQLFVSPAHRKLGHGSRLVKEVCEIAAAARCQSVNAVLAVRNRCTWPFYAKLGFHIAVEYPDGDYTICKVLGQPEPPNELRVALEKSVKLQSHYATLLNRWDGGERVGFETVDAWIARLRQTGALPKIEPQSPTQGGA